MRIPPTWGYYVGSPENIDAFVYALTNAASTFGAVDYLEVGLGNCGTINAVYALLHQINGQHTMTGVEIDSFTLKSFTPPNSRIIIDGRRGVDAIEKDKRFNVVFIDGCHCKECVLHDFIVVDPLIPDGGWLIFHDTCPATQGAGAEPGPHSERGVQVRKAMAEMDLSGYWPVVETHWNEKAQANGLIMLQKKRQGDYIEF